MNVVTNVIGTTEINQMQLIAAFLNKLAKKPSFCMNKKISQAVMLRDCVQRKSQVISLA